MKYFKILLWGLLFFSCEKTKESLPYYFTPDFTPFFLENKNDVDSLVSHKIGDFNFTDQNGKKVSKKSIIGKVHVANFFFTSCGAICPTITNNLKKVNEEYANSKEVVFLSFSVTPWIDTQEKLKEYSKQNQINSSNWHFLTGKKSEIYNLARKSYFAEEEIGFTKDSTDFLHTEHVLLIDKNLRIRGIYNGTLALDTQQLSKDIKTILEQ